MAAKVTAFSGRFLRNVKLGGAGRSLYRNFQGETLHVLKNVTAWRCVVRVNGFWGLLWSRFWDLLWSINDCYLS